MENQKVDIKLKNKNTITKKIGEQSYKIVPYIALQEKATIMEEIYVLYQERVQENEHLIPLLAGIIADMDLIILREKTNINLENISYDDLVCSGVLDTVKDTIVNYKDIRDSVEYMIFLFRLPDMSDMKNMNFDIKDLMKDKSQEEINEVIEQIQSQIEE